MTNEEIIDQAIIALGAGRDDDYILAPMKHAEEFKGRAPALARVLRTARVEAWARQYERLDAEAIGAQRTYKRTMAQANGAVLATALLSAAMLAAGVLGNQFGPAVLTTLGLCALITGAFASMWLSRVREGGLLEAWRNARASAENARQNYFQTIMDAGTGESPDIPLPLLTLEYFRRYQLDVQIAYYAARRRQHQKSADKTLMLASLAVALASVATGAAGLLGSKWAALAALGVAGTAVSAFASTREAVNNDRVNADRYGSTWSELEILRGDLDDVRTKALQADSIPALKDFIAKVHEKLSAEHGKWKEQSESMRSAIDTLEAKSKSLHSAIDTPGKAKQEILADIKPKD